MDTNAPGLILMAFAVSVVWFCVASRAVLWLAERHSAPRPFARAMPPIDRGPRD